MQYNSNARIVLKTGVITLLLLLCYTTFIFSVQPVKAENGSWTISGVVDDELGNHIPNVEIIAQDAITMDIIASIDTDDEGYYTMVVPQGTYNLIVTPPPESGYESMTISNIVVDSDRIVDIILIPVSIVTLDGYILDRDGVPVPNQQITLSSPGITVTDTTDAQGYYSLQVYPGLYSFTLSSWGYAPNAPSWYYLYREDGIQLDSNTEMIIYLPTRSFTGIVTELDGPPIPEAQLFIQGGTFFDGFMGHYEYETTTNDNGEFSFVVFAGSASLTVTPPLGSPLGPKLLTNLDLSQDLYLPIELTSALTFHGSILDRDGVPIPNQQITLSSPGITVTDTTDAQGRYLLLVSPGLYSLSLSSWGYAPNAPSWYYIYREDGIQLNSDTEMIINLPTRSFTGIVTELNGPPIHEAQLFIQGGSFFDGFIGHYEYGTTTDTNGEFSFVVFAGSASLTVTPPPGSLLEPKLLTNLDLSQDLYLPIELTSALTFHGSILDQYEEPVPNQQITLSSAGITVSDTTDAQGRYSLPISPGLYSLSLSPWGYAPNAPSWYYLYLEDGIQINSDTEMIINLPTRSFTGRVVDPDSVPIPDVQLFIQGSTSFDGFCGYYEYGTTTNADGEFSFVVLSGSASLTVTPPLGSPFGPKQLTGLNLVGNEFLIIQLVYLVIPPVAIADGPYVGVEGTEIILDASASNDPDGAIVLYEWDVDNDGVFEISTPSSITSFIPIDDYVGSVTLQITDDDGLISQATTGMNVENAAPILSEIIAPIEPLALGNPLTTSASFSDPGILDTHFAEWDWGDGTTSPGIIIEADGSGTVTGQHEYTLPGVYTITLTLWDNDGGMAITQFSYVVIYDNEQGFITGGGWYTSPEGAYTVNPLLTGKATFGFVAKYQKGASTPIGVTTFIFHVGGLKFHSTEYNWLVVAGTRAQFKGEGRINEVGNYGFLLTAIDGELDGGDGVDKFRIKIWDKLTDTIIYDNQLGSEDDNLLTTVIEGGNIAIHQNKKASLSILQKEAENDKPELLVQEVVPELSNRRGFSCSPQILLLLSMIIIMQLNHLKYPKK